MMRFALLIMISVLTSFAAAPKDELLAATRTLAAKSVYDWSTTNLTPTSKEPSSKPYVQYPLEGRCDKSRVIFLTQKDASVEYLISRPLTQTNYLIIQGDRSAIKPGSDFRSRILGGDASLDWIGFLTNRPSFSGFLDPPHLEIQNLINSATSISKTGETFELSFAENDAAKFFQERYKGNSMTAQVSATIWMTNSLPKKYEIHIDRVMTQTRFGPVRQHVQFHTATTILSTPPMPIEIPLLAQIAMKEAKTNRPPNSAIKLNHPSRFKIPQF